MDATESTYSELRRRQERLRLFEIIEELRRRQERLRLFEIIEVESSLSILYGEPQESMMFRTPSFPGLMELRRRQKRLRLFEIIEEQKKKRHEEEERRRAEELMDIPCSKDHLLKSSLLQFYSLTIGRQLLNNTLDVSNIYDEERTDQRRRKRMLLKWREEQGSGATYLRLFKVLQSFGYKDAADKVQQMATACTDFMDIPCSKDHLLVSSLLEFNSSTIGRQLLNDYWYWSVYHIYSVHGKKGTDQQRRERMLLKWRELQGSGATYLKLFKVLKSYGYKDAADEVLQMATACKEFMDIPCSKDHLLKSSSLEFNSSTIGDQLLNDYWNWSVYHIYSVHGKNGTDQQRRKRMLLKWREEQGSGATYLGLFKVLKSCGYNDAADKVQQMACKEAVTKRMPPASRGPTNCRKFGDGDGQNELVGKRNAGIWSKTFLGEGGAERRRRSWAGGGRGAKREKGSGAKTRGEEGGGENGTGVVNILRKSLRWTQKFKTSFFYQLTILLMLLSNIAGANASVTIAPCTDYTTFENNASAFTFNCSGDGTFLYWKVDEHDDSTSYVRNKGISYAPPVSPDGVTVSSQLIVPTTKANNNTVVICTVLDTSFKYFQSSDPVRLILQEPQAMLSPATTTCAFTAGPGSVPVGYTIVAGPIAVIGLLLLMVVGVACATYMYRAHEGSAGMKKHISK